MPEPEFQYGPISMSIFRGLLWLTPIFGFIARYFPNLILVYVSFLLFIAFGLRPLLLKTGVYRCYVDARHALGERRYRKLTRQRCAEVEAEKRRAKYKYRRYNNPELPKNW